MFNFKKKPTSPHEVANACLLNGIQALNVGARREGEWIVCSNGLQVRCSDVRLSNGDRVASLIVDLALSPNGPTLQENVADLGANAEQAITGAAFQWTMTVFVCACALFNSEGHPGHLASVQEASFPDATGTESSWRIISSPALSVPFGENENDHEQAPVPTWPFLEPLACELAQRPQLHTIKLLLMDFDDSRRVEASINGAPSPQIAPLLDTFPRTSLGTLRQFHLMVPPSFA